MWLVQSVTVLSFTFTFPFFPLFFKELGIDDPGRAAFVTGISGWTLGMGLGLFSPIWGAMGDRYGRKINVVRATAAAALVLGLSGFAQNPEQLIISRFFAGAFGGAGAAILALVVASTPRSHVTFATGAIQSAMFVGSTLGPVIGGILFDAYGMRWAFFANGIGLAIPAVLVIFFVHENFERPSEPFGSPLRPFRDALRTARSREFAPLLALVFLAHSAMLVIFPALPVIVEEVYTGDSPASASGMVFMAFGVASATSAIVTGFLAMRVGLKKTLVGLAVVASVLHVPPLFADSLVQLALMLAAIGLFQGGLIGSLNGLFAMAAPAGREGAVFGAQQTVMAGALSAGPLLGGTVAFTLGLRAVFAVNVVLFAVIAITALVLLPSTRSRVYAVSTESADASGASS